MNGCGKSDRSIRPEKFANKGSGEPLPAEQTEGRDLTKGNLIRQNRVRAQNRIALQRALERVRQAASSDRCGKFATLWHHVYNTDRLREAYFGIKRESAAGIDGETWKHYGQELESNLEQLSARLKRGGYHAKPVRRVYIPKKDRRQRPIGVTALEDKIAQRATVEVLQAVYETDFKGFSYGFRPKRGQHNALDAIFVGITQRKVNWVFDADIRGFYDAISHEWTNKFFEHRITDKRVLRHLNKWLKAGVLEEGKISYSEEGTPQGGSISPLIANVYLHYAFDLWADHWRRQYARGEVIIVRYADDIVVGFQYRSDAARFQDELRERFRKFNLELHADKTRLIEFGRFAADDRRKRGKGKPETFNFLGLTHICGKTKRGKFTVRRQTMRKRSSAKLQELNSELRRRMHEPIPEVGQWLRSVLVGHCRYYGVPGNGRALHAFREGIIWYWYRTLQRRSQRKRLNWERMDRLVKRWLPNPKIHHPYPDQRLRVNTQGKSPVR